MKNILKIISYIALGLMVLASLLVFGGTISIESNKTFMLILTVVWFLTAPSWILGTNENGI